MWVLIKLARLVHKCEGFWFWVVLVVSLFEFILIPVVTLFNPARIEVENDIQSWMGFLFMLCGLCFELRVPSIALKWSLNKRV